MATAEAIESLLKIYFWVFTVIISSKFLDNVVNLEKYNKIEKIQIENGTYTNKISIFSMISWVLYIFSMSFL